MLIAFGRIRFTIVQHIREFYGDLDCDGGFSGSDHCRAGVIEDVFQKTSESHDGFMRLCAALNFNYHMNKSHVLGNIFNSNDKKVP